MEGSRTMSKIFYVDDIPNESGFYMIRVDYTQLPLYYIQSSLNVLPARILGASYANYLRLCRDKYNAILLGKNCYYTVPIYKSKDDAAALCKILNEKIKDIMAQWHLRFGNLKK